jgi:hypothetical protein
MKLFTAGASQIVLGLCIIFMAAPTACVCAEAAASLEQWDVFEVALKGPTDGNPFVDVTFSARFTQGGVGKEVAGFYDGEGMYRVRFMPEQTGQWRYETKSNRAELDEKSGEFSVARPAPKNHGPVRVANTFHFAYADGAPFKQIGTTCYAWIHQGDVLEEQTLASLAAAPFNKLRMCVFPKSYAFNKNEPIYYPFEGTPPKKWDFERFNPKFFQHLEKRVGQLRDLGIEADVILFHPYDKGHWGFDRMGAAADDRYLRYLVARLAAYRNVWWSLANEFDFIKEKADTDWDRLFQIVQDSDPYGHLRSIHNGSRLYNHTLPWVTHASIQNGSAVEDFGRAALYRDVYRKPIVFDEVKYEGNIDQRWGQLTAEEMVHRFWQGTIAGTYVGHGETYLDPHDVLWWSKGGVLHGQSPARIEFLRKVLESAPPEGLDPIDKWQDPHIAGKAGEYYLIYFGKERPTQWIFELPRSKIADGARFRAEILDTWNMTITPVDGVFKTTAVNRYVVHAEGNRSVNLPGTLYMALRIRLTD